MVYQHKDHPEHLLRKLLKEEQYREDEKELFEMKCYLNDNKAKLYIDRVYGVLYLFLAPALAKQYLPRGSG